MTFAIRSATLADVSTIAEFNCRLAEESEHTQLELPITKLGVAAMFDDREKGVYYLACDGDRVIGQLMITREWSDWRNGWLWWIQSVYTHREHRGRGVFRALYDHIQRLAGEAGDVVGIRLYVDRNNAAGKATYSAVGMNPAGYEVFEAPARPQKT